MSELIQLDKWLLLQLNGSDSLWLDNVMWLLSATGTWALVLIALLFALYRSGSWRMMFAFVVALALAITLADQLSSGLIKPLVMRWRPTHDPEIGALIDVVRDYRGGSYGFVSSHAANVVAAAVLIAGTFRSRALSLSLNLWAALVSFSRIYLGVHYPGDIIGGAIIGALSGSLMLWAYRGVSRRWLPTQETPQPQWLLAALGLTYLAVLIASLFNI